MVGPLYGGTPSVAHAERGGENSHRVASHTHTQRRNTALALDPAARTNGTLPRGLAFCPLHLPIRFRENTTSECSITYFPQYKLMSSFMNIFTNTTQAYTSVNVSEWSCLCLQWQLLHLASHVIPHAWYTGPVALIASTW